MVLTCDGGSYFLILFFLFFFLFFRIFYISHFFLFTLLICIGFYLFNCNVQNVDFWMLQLEKNNSEINIEDMFLKSVLFLLPWSCPVEWETDLRSDMETDLSSLIIWTAGVWDYSVVYMTATLMFTEYDQLSSTRLFLFQADP